MGREPLGVGRLFSAGAVMPVPKPRAPYYAVRWTGEDGSTGLCKRNGVVLGFDYCEQAEEYIDCYEGGGVDYRVVRIVPRKRAKGE